MFTAHTLKPSYFSCALCILFECASAKNTRSLSTKVIVWMCTWIFLSMKLTWCLSCPSDKYSTSFLSRYLLASLRNCTNVPVNVKPKRSFRVFQHLTDVILLGFRYTWLSSSSTIKTGPSCETKNAVLLSQCTRVDARFFLTTDFVHRTM